MTSSPTLLDAEPLCVLSVSAGGTSYEVEFRGTEKAMHAHDVILTGLLPTAKTLGRGLDVCRAAWCRRTRSAPPALRRGGRRALPVCICRCTRETGSSTSTLP